MPERNNLDRVTHRSETTDPRNPPNSVVNPQARRSAVSTFVGGIVVVFLIVGAVFAYRSATGAGGDSELDVTEPSTIGTGGSGDREGASPGGFDPAPEHDSTRDEIEFRGAGEPLTGLGEILEAPVTVAGRRVDLRDAEVQSVDGRTLVIGDGDARATVIAAETRTDIRVGQRVDVRGTVEADGSGGARIRATRVDVK